MGPAEPCAKCKKTKKNVEKMLEDYPEYKEKIDYSHLDISSKTVIEKYGILQGPAVTINDILISQGQVPAVKKLKKKFEEVMTR